MHLTIDNDTLKELGQKLENNTLNRDAFIKLIEAAKELGLELQFKDDNGSKMDILFPIVENGHLEMFKLLFSFGDVDVNSKFDGDTLLHIAFEKRREDIVKMLLSHPVIDVNAEDNIGRTPLYLAAEADDLKIMKLLLDHSEIDIERRDHYGRTPLFLSWGVKGAAMFLSYGANPNVIDKLGRTPLTAVCRDRELDYVRVLLENGANPLIGKKSVLKRCDKDSDKERGKVKRALIQEYIDTIWKDGVPPLEAMCAWKMKSMKSQIDKDEQEELCDSDFPDALLHLYYRDWKGAYKWVYKWNEMIEEDVLCEMEADLKDGKITIEEIKEQIDWIGGAKDGKALWKYDRYFGQYDPKEVPILWCASVNGCLRIVEFLLSYPDCDVNVKGWCGRTALHEETENGHEEVVQMLVSHPDIDVNAEDKYGETALHTAASENGNVNVMKLLLEQPKIDIDTTNSDGETPLSASESAEITEILLESGANPNVVNDNGRTPLTRACRDHDLDHVRVLLENGADPLIGEKKSALECCDQDRDKKRGKAKRALVQEYIDRGGSGKGKGKKTRKLK